MTRPNNHRRSPYYHSHRHRDRQPGVLDMLFAGRSRSEKEADADAQQKFMLAALIAIVVLIWLLHAAFTAVGLTFGWWSAPVFVPALAWYALFLLAGGRARPRALELLSARKRALHVGFYALCLWAFWPAFADPAAHAWKAGHPSLHLLPGVAGQKAGLHYPLGAVLGASPLALVIVSSILVAIAMTACPRMKGREAGRPSPPRAPEALRARLLGQPGPGRERW